MNQGGRGLAEDSPMFSHSSYSVGQREVRRVSRWEFIVFECPGCWFKRWLWGCCFWGLFQGFQCMCC